MDEEDLPYELRFRAPMPPRTGAQQAATRVYNTNGMLTRSDPHVRAMDRFGQAFKPTAFAVEPADVPPQAVAGPVVQRGEIPESASVISRFRKKVLERGGCSGIHSLGRIFRLMDRDDNRRLSAQELKLGLQKYGLVMSAEEIDELVAAIDRDGSKTVRFNEFLMAIRGAINQRRQRMIDMAYEVLDKTGNGLVTMEDISGTYSASHDPDVMAGRLEEGKALENFLSMFDTIKSDGIVTRDEFKEYYRNVSASIDNDDYFELMIRNAWHIPGGEGWCANTSNTRLLVISSDGTQKVVGLDNDLGLDLRDPVAVRARLAAQGVTDVYKFTLSGDV